MVASFSFPTTILFGAGAVRELAARCQAIGASKPLIVTDPGLTKTPAFATTRQAAPSSAQFFSDTKSNPTLENVTDAVAQFRQHGCDSVIGLGGGSAIDVAKIVRLVVKLPQWKLGQPLPTTPIEQLAPFIAIPTTAGTGSEVGRSSVITIGGQKQVIFHPLLLAKLVILDPELTVDLPAKLTAATGADALTHCIESFTSPEFHPLCDGIALEGIRLIAQSLRDAVNEPKNLSARGNMLIAATMGGIAFQKDLGAAHSLAHPLSAICGLHHGLANALVLPLVMKFNAVRKPGLYLRVGEAMGLPHASDEATIAAVETLLREIGVPPGLRQHGVRDDQLDALADQAIADSCHKTNPVPVTRDDLRRLYQEAM
jgi:hypothetical protein